MTSKKKNNKTNILMRYTMISIVLLLISFGVIYKLFEATIIDAGAWNARAERELSRVATIAPERGNILADNGNILACNLKVYDIMLDLRHNKIRKLRQIPWQSIDSLADSLDMPSLMPPRLPKANGIDHRPFSGSHHAITSGKVNILMVAAFREQKDHLTPLHALAMLPPEVTLTYAGDGATRTATQEAARALGVADRVRFTGNVADIPGLYRQADIALLSTHHEGLSLSTVEAMASGMPLIVSDVPGVSEIVGDGALRFPFGDARALAARITSLLDNPALYAATARKGAERARLYDITVTADEYFNLYSSLISNKTNS